MTARYALLALPLLAGCATAIPPPPQPTYASVAADLAQLTAITADPVTTWQVADGGVRGACFAYLNSAASQQTSLALGSIGVGALGAGMSLLNPLAGVGASLGQTLLAGLAASGYVPTTADAIMVENYLNAYEASANASPPPSNASAVSWAIDEWYHCSAGGIAELAMEAKITAQMGSSSAGAFAAGTSSGSFAARASSGSFGRPVIVVNPPPAPVVLDPPDPTPAPPRFRVTPRARAAKSAAAALRARLDWLRQTATYIRALDKAPRLEPSWTPF